MIEFIKLENEREIVKHDLDSFASSFEHTVPRLFPVWTAYKDGKLLAYCHVRNQAVAYVAVPPTIKPRQFYELSWRWFTKLKVEHGDPLVVSPPRFTDSLLAKVGLEPLGANVYRVRD
jgi:hypothetical protein